MAYAIELYAPPDRADDLRSRVEIDLIDGPFPEALAEDRRLPFTVSERSVTGEQTIPSFTYGMARFVDSAPRDRLLQMVADGALADCDWYAVDVHDCTHDRPGGREMCGYVVRVAERGEVPSAI